MIINQGIIKPNKVILYKSYGGIITKRGTHDNSQNNLKDSKPKGVINKTSKKKLSKIIDTWTYAVQSQMKSIKKPKSLIWQHLTFVTLTLSSKQKHTDNYIKRKMLNHFIIQLSRKHKVKNYVWKAETQGNGNIHFHLLIDTAIHYSHINKKWNDIQSTYGYIQPFTEKFQKMNKNEYHEYRNQNKKVSRTKTLKAYKIHKEQNWTQPNSTDIHSLQKIKKISQYIGKYITKNNTSRKLEGRIWGITDKLRELDYYKFEIDDRHLEFIENLRWQQKIITFKGDYYEVFTGDINKIIKRDHPEISFKIQQQYKEQFKTLNITIKEDEA